MTDSPRIIKRYGNRKLYDTEAKRYLTLEEVCALVQDGAEVRVLDQATGEDITGRTLSRAVLTPKSGEGGLSLAALRELIQKGRDELRRGVKGVQENVQATRAGLEHWVDERIGAAFQGLHIPTPRDLKRIEQRQQSLERRVEQLQRRLDKLGRVGKPRSRAR